MGRDHKYQKNTANFIEWVGSELIYVLQFSHAHAKKRPLLVTLLVRGTSARTSTPSYKPGRNFAFQAPAVNCIASRPFRDKNNYKSRFFLSTWYQCLDNRERARARDKNQSRPISLKEKHKNFIAAVRKRGNASCHKMGGREKTSEQEHIQHFLHKTWY